MGYQRRVHGDIRMELQSLLEKLRNNRNKLNDGEPNEENVNQGLQLVIDILGYNIRPTDNIQVDEDTPNNSGINTDIGETTNILENTTTTETDLDGNTTTKNTVTGFNGKTTIKETVTDPNGNTTTTETRVIGSDGNSTTRKTDPNGNTTTTKTVIEPNGNSTTTETDPNGNTTTRKTDSDGNAIITVTNPNGKIIKRENQVPNDDGTITKTVTDPNGKTTKTVIDNTTIAPIQKTKEERIRDKKKERIRLAYEMFKILGSSPNRTKKNQYNITSQNFNNILGNAENKTKLNKLIKDFKKIPGPKAKKRGFGRSVKPFELEDIVSKLSETKKKAFEQLAHEQKSLFDLADFLDILNLGDAEKRTKAKTNIRKKIRVGPINLMFIEKEYLKEITPLVKKNIGQVPPDEKKPDEKKPDEKKPDERNTTDEPEFVEKKIEYQKDDDDNNNNVKNVKSRISVKNPKLPPSNKPKERTPPEARSHKDQLTRYVGSSTIKKNAKENIQKADDIKITFQTCDDENKMNDDFGKELFTLYE